MKLNRNLIESQKSYPLKVIQFGEGNFLRAFVDWMIYKANEIKQTNMGVCVVQPIENGLIDAVNEQDGLYTLYLNGVMEGKIKSDKYVIDVINKGINPYRDFDEFINLAENEDIRFIISNTTEAGIAYNEKDKLNDRPQKSYLGKLTALLYKRYKHFNGDCSKGFIIIPCELIDKNADNLKKIILRYSQQWKLGEEFIKWINEANVFCNSLVDRIVTGYPKDKIDEILSQLGYEDKLVVEGEQFHLWVIEGTKQVKKEFPLDQCGLNVKFVEDITPYRTRKVRILNGAHTSMVPVSLLYGLDTVKETIDDKVMSDFVKGTIFDEIIPTLDLPQDELHYFANAVLDRFRNPFIKHFLISISLNSNSKFETRVLPSILEYKNRKGKLPKKLVFSFAALIRLYKGNYKDKNFAINDDKEIMNMYKNLWDSCDCSKNEINKLVSNVLSQKSIWKMDLNKIEGLTEAVAEYLYIIENEGIETAIKNI